MHGLLDHCPPRFGYGLIFNTSILYIRWELAVVQLMEPPWLSWRLTLLDHHIPGWLSHRLWGKVMILVIYCLRVLMVLILCQYSVLRAIRDRYSKVLWGGTYYLRLILRLLLLLWLLCCADIKILMAFEPFCVTGSHRSFNFESTRNEPIILRLQDWCRLLLLKVLEFRIVRDRRRPTLILCL